MIAVLDMRSMEIKTRLQHPLELGPISAVCPTPHWLIVGTVTGSLSLWDLRFGLLLKSWAARGGITSCAIHPSRGRGRWVMVSLDRDDNNDTNGGNGGADVPLVETYDIETGKLVEAFEARTTRPSSRSAPPPGRDVLQTKSELIAELAGGRGGLPTVTADSNETPSVQSLLVGQGFASLTAPVARDDDVSTGGGGAADRERAQPLRPGWMVTAGDDRMIRYWDLARVSDGFVLCGSPREKDVVFKSSGSPSATPQLYYTLPNARPLGTSPADSNRGHAANSQRQALRPHYDAICALGVVETPFSSCVVSADRSGVIKVWRMEGSPVSRP